MRSYYYSETTHLTSTAQPVDAEVASVALSFSFSSFSSSLLSSLSSSSHDKVHYLLLLSFLMRMTIWYY